MCGVKPVGGRANELLLEKVSHDDRTMPEQSAYQKKKAVTDALAKLDKGQKAQALEELLVEWAQTLPRKGKEYGVETGTGKYAQRLEWLTEHWGTPFKVEKNGKESNALRRMPLSGVLELLTLFCLNVGDSQEDVASFGTLEDDSELGEKVASGLSELKAANGPVVAVTFAAFKELQRLAREAQTGGAVEGPRTSTAILEKLAAILQATPGVKTEKEAEAYNVRRAKYDAKKAEKKQPAS